MKVGPEVQGTDIDVVSKSYEGNKMAQESPSRNTPPITSHENVHKASDKLILYPTG